MTIYRSKNDSSGAFSGSSGHLSILSAFNRWAQGGPKVPRVRGFGARLRGFGSRVRGFGARLRGFGFRVRGFGSQ